MSVSEEACLEDSEELIEDVEEGEELQMEQSTPEKRARHAITGRGVTIQMLMADGMIQAGEGVLSLEYLGQKFTADLLPNGKIKSCETGEVFGSPSSWAIFCKKLVNPAKKSGCGWASVKYKGRKLDSWKTSWFRQQKPRKPNIPGSQSPASSILSDTSDSHLKSPDDIKCHRVSDIKSHVTDVMGNISHPSSYASLAQISVMSDREPVQQEADLITDNSCVLDLTVKPRKSETPSVESATRNISDVASFCFMGEQEEALNLSLKPDPLGYKSTSSVVKTETLPCLSGSAEMGSRDKTPIRHSSLPHKKANMDMNQLVACEFFASSGNVQPYTVSMSTNSLLLIDFHCHLTTSEVVGYLGGKWDQTSQHLSIQQAFPCRCRLSDAQNAPLVEEEIRSTMKHQGMSLVGWYHSHPYCQPEPSVRDVECQMGYQLKMRGNKSNYYPCVGIINSPYYNKSLTTASSLQMYMTMPPTENSKSDIGVPMKLKYTVKQNHSVSEEALKEMHRVVEFYRRAPDWISFQHTWHPGVNFLEKLKTSLLNKLPEDQGETNSLLDYIHHLLIV
ncbi:MPN domain-containing protein-like [Mya arenaria]|uniref:MPN domain-containing protein-like n=1 Tax=Mya arenaria TaxID=6604 RepID=UPI0022E297B5|nr:MPN domain-containing protein-like [Mya arenaria]